MAWIVDVGVQRWFTESQMQNNALEFYNEFGSYSSDITLACIAGILGNITVESGINPGNKQGESYKLGWGLIQWSPSTHMTNWIYENYGTSNWANGSYQTELIWLEGYDEPSTGYMWIPDPDSGYEYTWDEFIALEDVYEACEAYLYERERAGIARLDKRLEWAEYWYEFLSGEEPPTPPEPQPEPTDARRRQWIMLRNKQLFLKRTRRLY